MDQKKIDACYAIENDTEALECLKGIIRTAEGECRPKLVLLTQEYCIPCKEEKARHKEALEEGVIQELSVHTEKGKDVASKNEIELIPALILLDCKDKIIYPSESV